MRLLSSSLIFLLQFSAASLVSAVESVGNEKLFMDNANMVHYSVPGNFEEVKDLLTIAIADQGIKISSTSYISNMLQRTRKDVGADKDIFVSAEAIEFCSATLSRSMMEAMPHSIIFCPYIIYIYVLADQPGKVNLAYRKLPVIGSAELQTALSKVNQLLDGIIKEVVE